MERPRLALIALMFFLFYQKIIYGEEVEMKVRPGDNITLFCDCSVTLGSSIVWIRNCSHENQSSLIVDFRKLDVEIFQRFSFIHNLYNNSYDLHITNISVSDLGLYYCAKLEIKVNEDGKGIISSSEVYYYGKQTIRLSLGASDLLFWTPEHHLHPTSCIRLSALLDAAVQCVSSVCPVCCLFSSICVFCLCCRKATDSATDQKHKLKGRNIIEENDDSEVCYASVDLMTRRQNRHKKTQVPSSDITTYAPVRTETE